MNIRKWLSKHQKAIAGWAKARWKQPSFRRSVKTGLVLAAVLFLLFLTLIIIYNVKFTFVINDELNLVLTPLYQSFTVQNDAAVTANFSITNDNFLQCRSECTLQLIDLRDGSDGSEASRRHVELSHGETITEQVTLEAPGRGRGQVLYNFKAYCRNVRTLLCRTHDEPRLRAALIALNYDLAEDEQEIIAQVRPGLEGLMALLANASELRAQNELLLQRLPESMAELAEASDEQGAAVSELSRQNDTVAALLRLWGSQDYRGLSRAYARYEPTLESTLEEAIDRLKAVQDRMVFLLGLRNENIILLGELEEEWSRIRPMLIFYANETSSQNDALLHESEDILSRFGRDAAAMTSRSASEAELHERLTQNLVRLHRGIDGYEELALRGRLALALGRAQLAIKVNVNASDDSNASAMTSARINESFSCDALRSLVLDINVSNAAAQEYRLANYNESLDNASFMRELDRTRLALERESRVLVREILNLSLEGISLDTASNASFTFTLPEKERMAMVILDAGDAEEFVKKNCRRQNRTANVSAAAYQQPRYTAELERVSTNVPQVSAGAGADTTLAVPAPQCCVFNACDACHDKGSLEAVPVIFVHGHVFNKENTPEFSMGSFAKMQQRLEEEGYINAGELDVGMPLDDLPAGEWGRSGRQVSVRATYYYINYYAFGSYLVAAQKSERIENYAIRLKEIIDDVRHLTGAGKVTIVAHSMGGLVAREYLWLFGSDHVSTLITINTPHHGISPGKRRWCSAFGADLECGDMAEGSIFLSRLNARPLPDDVVMHAVQTTGCDMGAGRQGDGIVTSESATLSDAANHLIEADCPSSLGKGLHTAVLDPDDYPQTFEIIKNALPSL